MQSKNNHLVQLLLAISNHLCDLRVTGLFSVWSRSDVSILFFATWWIEIIVTCYVLSNQWLPLFPIWIWGHIRWWADTWHNIIAILSHMIFLCMSLFGFLAFKSRRRDLIICFTIPFLKFVSDPSLNVLLVHIDLVWFAFSVPLIHSYDIL